MEARKMLKVALLGTLITALGMSVSGSSAQQGLQVCPAGCRFSSIQAAVEAAASGDTVLVWPAAYKENLSIRKSLTVMGAARDTVIIEGFEEDQPAVRIRGRVRVVLQELTLSEAKPGPTSKSLADGARISDEADVTLARVRISSNTDDGLVIFDRAQVRVLGSIIADNADDGIFVGRGTRGTFENNVITGNGGCGIWSVSAQVEGRRNEMEENGADLCGNVSARLRIPLVPATNQMEIAVPGQFSDLQKAIDAVHKDGTIRVAPGMYTGGLTIYKRLAVEGAGVERVVLKGSGRAPVISLITGADVRIEGLTLTQGRDGLKAAGQANGVISAVVATENTDDGIEGRDEVQLVIENSQLTQNAEEGIFLTGSAQAKVEGNRIMGNGRDGIMLLGGPQAEIQDNRILGNGGWGIAVWIDACHEEAADDQTFTGVVRGGGNELSDNGRGDLCGVSSSLKEETGMELSSEAFGLGGRIPDRYTCEGRDVSPPLSIRNVTPRRPEASPLLWMTLTRPGASSTTGSCGTSLPTQPRFPKAFPIRSR